MSDLHGKVAVVTGASKGIGAAIARALSAAGAAVVVNYSSSKDGAKRVVAEIAAKGGKAVAIQGDVAKPAEVTRLFDETKKAFGRLDVLVNNAGIYKYVPLTRSPRKNIAASSTSTCWAPCLPPRRPRNISVPTAVASSI
jgi:3-oxoacyl-[acyl-carrier protein] reductase